MTGLVDAAREVKEHGTFRFLERTLTTAELHELMTARS
jgi:hypothetical protein